MLKNGTVYSFGRGGEGRLGLGDSNRRLSPTKITTISNVIDIAAGADHSLFLDANGDVYGCGTNGVNILSINSYFIRTGKLEMEVILVEIHQEKVFISKILFKLQLVDIILLC